MVETHGLLIGEAADPEIVAAITELARAEPGVLHINEDDNGEDDRVKNRVLSLTFGVRFP